MNKATQSQLPGTGSNIEVQLIAPSDGSNPQVSIATDTISVRKVRLHNADELARVFGDLEKEAVVYVDKPAEWIQTITDESLIAILIEGRRLNVQTLRAWMSLQQESIDVLTAGSAGNRTANS
ncbi:MAG: hypothetical protein ACO1QB_12055 [Verrucomicrobiales bacterium]